MHRYNSAHTSGLLPEVGPAGTEAGMLSLVAMQEVHYPAHGPRVTGDSPSSGHWHNMFNTERSLLLLMSAWLNVTYYPVWMLSMNSL